MGKIAFVFAGQGAQAPGMGKDLYEAFVPAKDCFDRLEALRPGTLRQCFAGDETELRETKNTQPCLYAVESAAAAVLGSFGLRADMTAGFSLGELAALNYAGVCSCEEGFRLVTRRGELMQRDSELQDTAMAAVVRLSNEQVEALCADFAHIYPVNYNCPGQVTVSGLAEEMPAFSAAVKAAGGRALPLKVRAAFHSPYMHQAGEDFRAEIAAAQLRAPQIPLWSNFTGTPYGADPALELGEQMCHPVLWETSVRGMIAAGADTFVEIGPGKTLTGFISKIDAAVRCFNVSTAADAELVRKELISC